MTKSIKAAIRLCACGGILAGVTGQSSALQIVFRDLTPGGMTSAEMSAMQNAAAMWTSILADPVTVNIDVKFVDIGNPNALGFTNVTKVQFTYNTARNALTGDATTSADLTAVANLQPSSTLSFRGNNLDGTWRFDNDVNLCSTGPSQPCRNNNRLVLTSSADAKALGFNVNLGGRPDATITFNSLYATDGYFDFDRSDGINAGTIDFAALAAHEIEHALGFFSGVAGMESNARTFQNGNPGGWDNQYFFEQFPTYTFLDLFRYSAPDGVMDVRYGVPSYFSIDRGLTDIEDFSPGISATGYYAADHFFPDRFNLMNPYIFEGVQYGPGRADILALDVIGWDAVPEPDSLPLLAVGLAVGVFVRRGRTAGTSKTRH